MMTIEEFRGSRKKDKFRIVAENGVFLCNRMENDCAIFLFAVNKFYVEVWFDNNVYYADHLEVLEDRGLRKYLDLISIKELNPLLN